jgi:general stress protein YciG
MTGTADTQVQKPAKAGRRGFASMAPERQRELASMGGRAAHRSGNAHQFTPEEARLAGSKSRRIKATSTGGTQQQE